jgi:hypothetical protein
MSVKKIKKELEKLPQYTVLEPIGTVGKYNVNVGVGFDSSTEKKKPEAIIGASRSDSNDTSYLYGSVNQKGINQVGIGKNFNNNQGDISAGVSKEGFGIRGTVRFQAGGKVDKKTKPKKQLKDPYLERNEFKPGFYDQLSKPPVTPSTYYGTASGKTSFESPIVDPDTSMMQSANMKDGGMVKGNGKVLKDRIKKTKYY